MIMVNYYNVFDVIDDGEGNIVCCSEEVCVEGCVLVNIMGFGVLS